MNQWPSTKAPPGMRVRTGRFPNAGQTYAVPGDGPHGLLVRSTRRPRLVVPVQDLVRHPAVGRAVDEGAGVGSVPLHADDGHRGIGKDAADGAAGREVFESHAMSPFAVVAAVRRASGTTGIPRPAAQLPDPRYDAPAISLPGDRPVLIFSTKGSIINRKYYYSVQVLLLPGRMA